jgi:ribosomal protein L40E
MAGYVDKGLRGLGIAISKPMLAVVCIISGLMVILLPSLLVWTIGLFLVIQGVLLLTDHYGQEKRMITASTSEGVYCHNCGEGNTDGAAYCRKCGKELVQTGPIVATQPQEPVPKS